MFTGQKQDGTGLLYYNARFYDPALGIFISPDTLVPDAGRVVDYNRFLYVRGNPLKFSDPSGHCALLDDGSRSSDDAECWEKADSIYNLWPGGEDWWSALFRMDRDTWMEIIGGNPGTDAAYMQGHLDRYWFDFNLRTGLIRPVSLEPVPPHPIEGVANAIAPIILADCETRDCVALSIDSIGVAGSSLTLASPVCGPFILECAGVGTAIGRGATIVGLGWTIVQGSRDNASNADGFVAGLAAGVSLTTKNPRIGLLAGVSQFLWDTFISPFDAWR